MNNSNFLCSNFSKTFKTRNKKIEPTAKDANKEIIEYYEITVLAESIMYIEDDKLKGILR